MASNNLFAETILHQLGGRHFIAMTGSSNFVYDNKSYSITMQLRKNLLKAKWLKIFLTPADTYRMQFITINKDEEVIILKEFDGIYADQLQEIFTQETGLLTFI